MATEPTNLDRDTIDSAIVRAAEEVATAGVSIAADFLAPGEVLALAEECRALRLAGGLHPGHVGRGDARALRPDIRGDSIRWLRDAGETPAQRCLLGLMERLRVEINRRTFLGLFDLECHFAIYPPGALYRRHLDRFCNESHRVVSWVLYLNDAWKENDGGCLRIYRSAGGDFLDVPPGGGDFLDVPPGGGDFLDVPPVGGTLVAFLSAEYEHEVLAARRERVSIAGWFRTARTTG